MQGDCHSIATKHQKAIFELSALNIIYRRNIFKQSPFVKRKTLQQGAQMGATQDPAEYPIHISVEDSLHNFRTELPNIIFEMGLDVYEFTTYAHLKRAAGDRGGCWKSSRTLCKEIGISHPKFIEIKKSLQSKNLIRIEKRVHEHGGAMTDYITIVDLWSMNMSQMLMKKAKGGGGKQHLPGVVNAVNQGGKQRLPKEEHIEEEHIEEQQQRVRAQETEPIPDIPVAAVSLDQPLGNSEKFTIYPELKEVDIPESDKIEITSRYARLVAKNAIEWATHPETKISTTLVQAIKWACKNKPKVPKNKVDEVEQNKQYAEKHDEMKSDIGIVEAMPSCVQIVYTTSQKEPTGIKYEEKGFLEKFKSAMRKININPLPA